MLNEAKSASGGSKKIHFIGIKGVGMAALAVFAKEMGNEVTGSDNENVYVTDKILKKAGIEVSQFNIENLKSRPDLVITSAAYDKDNIEIKEAKKRHLEIKPYSEALAYFSKDHQVIAVAGIHGKSTTTAMLAWLLTKADLDPSFIVGAGEIKNLETNAHYGQGDYFILEADEYRRSPEDSTPKFFDLSSKIEIISSIEMDHPDIYSSEENVYNAFYKFACRVPRNGFIVLCLDYPKSRKLKRSLVDRNFETYGFSEAAEWRIIDYQEKVEETEFWLLHDGQKIGPFRLKVPGMANVLNATAAAIVSFKIGLAEKLIKKYLGNFAGVKRRFEMIGKLDNFVILDDYAHHPRSIRMTLEAVRAKFPQSKIWCIFQPHTYSRTKSFLNEFATSFKLADKIIITDIFASEREKDGSISGQDLALAIRKNHRSVRYNPSWSKIKQDIINSASGPIVLMTIGAGDIYKLAEEIYQGLQNV